MKNLILILILLMPLFGKAQCPIYGNSPKTGLRIADSLKNRYSFPDTSKAFTVDVNELIDDRLLLKPEYVKVKCLIHEVIKEAGESCNCHSKDDSMVDYHIYISDSVERFKADCGVVEITRFSRKTNPKLTYKYVKSLEGKEVWIYGLLFLDLEHKNQINKWRKGITEIHPVQDIIEIK